VEALDLWIEESDQNAGEEMNQDGLCSGRLKFVFFVGMLVVRTLPFYTGFGFAEQRNALCQ
jgi:hypothetical protein